MSLSATASFFVVQAKRCVAAAPAGGPAIDRFADSRSHEASQNETDESAEDETSPKGNQATDISVRRRRAVFVRMCGSGKERAHGPTHDSPNERAKEAARNGECMTFTTTHKAPMLFRSIVHGTDSVFSVCLRQLIYDSWRSQAHRQKRFISRCQN